MNNLINHSVIIKFRKNGSCRKLKKLIVSEVQKKENMVMCWRESLKNLAYAKVPCLTLAQFSFSSLLSLKSLLLLQEENFIFPNKKMTQYSISLHILTSQKLSISSPALSFIFCILAISNVFLVKLKLPAMSQKSYI